MNKVYILGAGENWIVDRFVKEWSEDNQDITVTDPWNADVIWLLADWCFKQLPHVLLQSKTVITTVHHIVPEKFDKYADVDFVCRDKLTDVYHVYNQITYDFIRPLTDKKIVLIPYWANQRLFQPLSVTREWLRKKYHLLDTDYICGSFQRDTEGAGVPNGIFLPKLEKGPDIFCDYVESLAKTKNNVHVLLAGWRRQYVIDRLDKAGIKFTYHELPSAQVLNELYQCLDTYVVSARCEGGPQALLECGLLNVPTISTPVGIAHNVLPQLSINNDLMKCNPTIPVIPNEWKLPRGYELYRKLIEEL